MLKECIYAAASWTLEAFGVVGAYFSLQLSPQTQFAKIRNTKSYRQKSM